MKILIICSKAFYKDIMPIKTKLEEMGHIVELPNSYYESDVEKKSWDLGEEEHAKFKERMMKMSRDRIGNMDAVLTLNFDKNGMKNYIGVATFLEVYEAFMQNKKIYLNGSNNIYLDFPVKVNDLIEVDLNFEEDNANIVPVKMDLNILYEDDS